MPEFKNPMAKGIGADAGANRTMPSEVNSNVRGAKNLAKGPTEGELATTDYGCSDSDFEMGYKPMGSAKSR